MCFTCMVFDKKQCKKQSKKQVFSKYRFLSNNLKELKCIYRKLLPILIRLLIFFAIQRPPFFSSAKCLLIKNKLNVFHIMLKIFGFNFLNILLKTRGDCLFIYSTNFFLLVKFFHINDKVH